MTLFQRDEADFMRLSHSLGSENPEVMICFRLGRKHETQNRPLKIVLANKSHRKYLLDNAKTLPEKAPTYMKDVIISRDLTPEQRKERKSRGRQGASQQQQRAVTEQQDHDVETINRPRIQFSAPQPMNIDQRPPPQSNIWEYVSCKYV